MKIVHLIDDNKPGGVVRSLEHLIDLVNQNELDCDEPIVHQIVRIERGALTMPEIHADVIVSHLTMSWRGLPALSELRARFANKRLIHIEHSYSRAFEANKVARPGRFRTMLRLGYSLFDTIVAVSRAQREWMLDRQLGHSARIVVISPAVDVSGQLALAPPTFAGALRVAFVGRLHEQKGVDLLLEAVGSSWNQDFDLSIYGSGPEEALLRAKYDDRRVTFKGFVSDPLRAYAESDVVVMPSRWEPYGLVCLEARAAARPCIVAGVDGLVEQCNEAAFVIDASKFNGWTEVFDGFANRTSCQWRSASSRARHSARNASKAYQRSWASLLGLVSRAQWSEAHEVAA